MKSILLNTEAEIQRLKFNIRTLPEIELVERELYNSLSDSEGTIREMCGHILNAGGKRIRPLLVLYSGMVFSPQGGELIYAAVASELIHMASLVHDDIIDNSTLRRSRPSVNKIWGNHFAVLCGDYLFAKAFGILSEKRLLRSMDYMVQAITNMCHGEIMQAGDQFNSSVGMDSYFERIAKKTAIFLECCCKSGAAAAGANEMQMEVIGEYGLNLGLAFQIMDDILDLCGDVESIGKPNNEDLSQGNITLPVILLLEDGKYSLWIREAIEKRSFTSEFNANISKILKESGILSRCFHIASSHIEKAKSRLHLLPESSYVEKLLNIADMLKVRAN